jgi:hypothetical protein
MKILIRSNRELMEMEEPEAKNLGLIGSRSTSCGKSQLLWSIRLYSLVLFNSCLTYNNGSLRTRTIVIVDE